MNVEEKLEKINEAMMNGYVLCKLKDRNYKYKLMLGKPIIIGGVIEKIEENEFTKKINNIEIKNDKEFLIATTTKIINTENIEDIAKDILWFKDSAIKEIIDKGKKKHFINIKKFLKPIAMSHETAFRNEPLNPLPNMVNQFENINNSSIKALLHLINGNHLVGYKTHGNVGNKNIKQLNKYFIPMDYNGDELNPESYKEIERKYDFNNINKHGFRADSIYSISAFLEEVNFSTNRENTGPYYKLHSNVNKQKLLDDIMYIKSKKKFKTSDFYNNFISNKNEKNDKTILHPSGYRISDIIYNSVSTKADCCHGICDTDHNINLNDENNKVYSVNIRDNYEIRLNKKLKGGISTILSPEEIEQYNDILSDIEYEDSDPVTEKEIQILILRKNENHKIENDVKIKNNVINFVKYCGMSSDIETNPNNVRYNDIFDAVANEIKGTTDINKNRLLIRRLIENADIIKKLK